MADTDDLFDSTDGALGDFPGSGDGADASPASPESGSDAPQSDSSAEDKGVAYWMSKAQKAEAALRKAQGLDSKGKPKQDTTPNPEPVDAADDGRADRLSEMEKFLADGVRERIFNEDPRLRDFGFSLEDIDGDSLAEMRASFKQLVGVIDRAESRALNRAFETVGIDPSLAGGPREKRDFASMSDEEIEREIARAKGLA